MRRMNGVKRKQHMTIFIMSLREEIDVTVTEAFSINMLNITRTRRLTEVLRECLQRHKMRTSMGGHSSPNVRITGPSHKSSPYSVRSTDISSELPRAKNHSTARVVRRIG